MSSQSAVPMTLQAELPSLLSLLPCAIIGWALTNWLKRKYLVTEPSTVSKKVEVEEEETPQVVAPNSLQSRTTPPCSETRRRPRRRSGKTSASVAAEEQQAESVQDVSETDLGGFEIVEDRIAKMMAKKAERKERKAREEAEEDARTTTERDHIPAAPARMDLPPRPLVCATPFSTVAHEIQARALGPQTELVSEVVDMGVKEAKQLDQSEGSTEQEQFDTESLEANTDESDKEYEVENAEEGEEDVVAVGDIETDDQWEKDDDSWACHSGSKWDAAQQHWKDEIPTSAQDCWMSSFAEIGNAGCCPPSSQSVEGYCMYDGSNDMNANSSVAAICIDTQQAFSDGQKVYEPIISNNGQQLYTDGQQIYQMAVFEVSGPPPDAGVMAPYEQVYSPYMGPLADTANLAEPEYWQNTCNADMNRCYDSYNSVSYRNDPEPPSKDIDEEDVWNVCWDLVRPSNW